MEEEKVYFDNRSGNKLCGILSKGSGKTAVIVAHGHGSHKNSKTYIDLSKFFSEKNIPIFRFDFYGHGESEGNFSDFSIKEAVQDILSAINFLKSKGYEKFILMGKSRGGISVLRASAISDDVIAAAMACPGSRSENYEEVYEIAEKIKIPCLIVHGTKDEIIPIENSRRISSVLENCTYVEIKDSDHNFSDPSHYNQMLKLVSEFILEKYKVLLQK